MALTRKYGPNELENSALCFGTMQFGDGADEKDSQEMYQACRDNGINFFDTAEMYPSYPKKETYGMSEEFIGEWIKSKGNRDKIVIASKIASNHPKGIGATKLSWIRKGGENLKFDKNKISDIVENFSEFLQIENNVIDNSNKEVPKKKILNKNKKVIAINEISFFRQSKQTSSLKIEIKNDYPNAYRWQNELSTRQSVNIN